MKRNQNLLIIIISFILFNSCNNSVISKDKNSKKTFQTVVLKGDVVKAFLADPSFRYCLFEYDSRLFGDIMLTARANDDSNNNTRQKFRLEKPKQSRSVELVNTSARQLYLSRDTMLVHGMDGSSDYILTPVPYSGNLTRSEFRGQSFVSYYVDRQILSFQSTFKAFRLDPSPPAPKTP